MASNYSNLNVALLDGVDMYAAYGAKVLKANGFIFPAKIKEPKSYNWPDEHGVDVDLSELYYDKKDVSLEFLVISQTSLTDLRNKLKSLVNAFVKPGLRHLKLAGVDGVYLVYYNSNDGARESVGVNGSQVATLKINLTEPNPVYYQFYSDRSTNLNQVSLAITTSRALNILWGDGAMTPVSGSGTFTHTYTANGHYCIIITGSVQGITAITPTNAILI